MPELPEVQALAAYLSEHVAGDIVAGVDVTAISVLKTVDPPLTSLAGLSITRVGRYGKFLDLDVDGLHLVIHLARAGWLRWRDGSGPPVKPARPGKGPLALRVRLASGASMDVTEAGTQKRLAVYLVRDPADVPGVAALGPDPLADAFTPQVLGQILDDAGRAQLKGVLRDQKRIAGIGNAYSDDVLHAARLSPFAAASGLSELDRQVLHRAVVDVLRDAVDRSAGLPAGELKDSKRAGMRVHGRTGQACDVCGDTVREVSFADSSLQYCATCQTGGKPLADRRMSRLLR
ncbi:MAG: DNA-formamidopyrimidine glycosylase family protein [Jiangellales bacterium]|jgi:formamidopyrimidine-DNA glycosylase